jgi:dinuclear metal center YbgI/SA1388 family protein
MSTVRVTHLERAIAQRFPLERAEEWDRCGLLVGDPDAVVSGVVLALDPTVAAVEFARESGANVVITHHPAFLKPPQWLTAGRGAAGVVFSALSHGVALINAHTNLDRDEAAQVLMPEMLGLTPVRPLERSVMEMSLVTVYAPPEASARITDAMAGAGAGRIETYNRCQFSSAGTAQFTAGPGSTPYIGSPDTASSAEELRIEMVAPRTRARAVVAAAVSAHPYETPLVTASDVVIPRHSARLGMICDVTAETSLEAFARDAGARFAVTPRVWGDPSMMLKRVATATGSASSLVSEAINSGVQALVAGEVRYHDALDAVAAGVAVVELGHDVTEWPLVTLLEQVVRAVPDIEQESVHALPATAGWWTPETK